MQLSSCAEKMFARFVTPGCHAKSDYFSLIKKIVGCAPQNGDGCDPPLQQAYAFVEDEIRTSTTPPSRPITFGTSGWRGILGKDINVHTVSIVTDAIIDMYRGVDGDKELAELLGVKSFAEAQQRGCVLGFDNRFAGELLATAVAARLVDAGFLVHYAGESTTGVLSAAVLELSACCSINLTPSHNPLEYGGYKFNGADAGPAASQLTTYITQRSREILAEANIYPPVSSSLLEQAELIQRVDSLQLWKNFVVRGSDRHGLCLNSIVAGIADHDNLCLAVDSVHGASRLHIGSLFAEVSDKLKLVRADADYTFGGVSPEPSAANLGMVRDYLQARPELLKLGAIIDPDGDRIRFTDGQVDISMNQFGAMAYHFLFTHKGVSGMLAKSVATSNLANRIAEAFAQPIFEPAVGFKEFKPVIGEAVVCFEESDGISIIGHTPEKDAYIGLLLALEMILLTGKNLGEYLAEVEADYGAYYPAVGSIAVSKQGEELTKTLAQLDDLQPGSELQVAGKSEKIVASLGVDGRKMIFADGSWILIRPSGTEPKVRFYVESRSSDGAEALFATARLLLANLGLTTS